jgi:hypothetical protein
MTQAARLVVLILDHENNNFPPGVSLWVSNDGTRQPMAYDRDLGRHVAMATAGVPIELHAEGPAGWEPATCALIPRAGDNHIRMAIGPRDALFYTAANGRRIFFKTSSKMMLEGRGPELRRRLRDLLSDARDIVIDDHGVNSAESAHRVSWSLDFAGNGNAEDRWQALDEVAARVETVCVQNSRARLCAPMHHASGRVAWLSNELVIGFKTDVPSGEREQLARAHGLELVRDKLPYIGNASVLRRKGAPRYDILHVASALRAGHEQVAFVEPNLVYELQKHAVPNDFLYPEQPELQLIGAPAAWAQLGGAGHPEIAVAVVDTEGVDPDHPDLPRPFDNWNFVDNRPQSAEDLGGDHGTQCASSAVGIFNNQLGTVGVAGSCRLIGARIPSHITGTELADIWG